MPKKENVKFNLENALKQLSEIVASMEKGELSLEDSLKQFERGIQLTRQSQKVLQDAEQSVKILLQQNGEEILEPFQDPK